MLMNGAISWSSCKQRTAAQNTTEAEYMAITDAANQVAWYWSFLIELGYIGKTQCMCRKQVGGWASA